MTRMNNFTNSHSFACRRRESANEATLQAMALFFFRFICFSSFRRWIQLQLNGEWARVDACYFAFSCFFFFVLFCVRGRLDHFTFLCFSFISHFISSFLFISLFLDFCKFPLARHNSYQTWLDWKLRFGIFSSFFYVCQSQRATILRRQFY